MSHYPTHPIQKGNENGSLSMSSRPPISASVSNGTAQPSWGSAAYSPTLSEISDTDHRIFEIIANPAKVKISKKKISKTPSGSSSTKDQTAVPPPPISTATSSASSSFPGGSPKPSSQQLQHNNDPHTQHPLGASRGGFGENRLYDNRTFHPKRSTPSRSPSRHQNSSPQPHRSTPSRKQHYTPSPRRAPPHPRPTESPASFRPHDQSYHHQHQQPSSVPSPRWGNPSPRGDPRHDDKYSSHGEFPQEFTEHHYRNDGDDDTDGRRLSSAPPGRPIEWEAGNNHPGPDKGMYVHNRYALPQDDHRASERVPEDWTRGKEGEMFYNHDIGPDDPRRDENNEGRPYHHRPSSLFEEAVGAEMSKMETERDTWEGHHHHPRDSPSFRDDKREQNDPSLAHDGEDQEPPLFDYIHASSSYRKYHPPDDDEENQGKDIGDRRDRDHGKYVPQSEDLRYHRGSRDSREDGDKRHNDSYHRRHGDEDEFDDDGGEVERRRRRKQQRYRDDRDYGRGGGKEEDDDDEDDDAYARQRSRYLEEKRRRNRSDRDPDGREDEGGGRSSRSRYFELSEEQEREEKHLKLMELQRLSKKVKLTKEFTEKDTLESMQNEINFHNENKEMSAMVDIFKIVGIMLSTSIEAGNEKMGSILKIKGYTKSVDWDSLDDPLQEVYLRYFASKGRGNPVTSIIRTILGGMVMCHIKNQYPSIAPMMSLLGAGGGTKKPPAKGAETAPSPTPDPRNAPVPPGQGSSADQRNPPFAFSSGGNGNGAPQGSAFMSMMGRAQQPPPPSSDQQPSTPRWSTTYPSYSAASNSPLSPLPSPTPHPAIDPHQRPRQEFSW